MKKNSTVLRYIRETDKVLLLLCFIASVFSVLCLMGIANTFSSITRPMKMQALASILGIGIALIISSIDYHTLAGLWKIHMPLAIVLVLATFIFGMQRAGADDRAWLILPGGLSFQPSEILKLSFILTFALHLSLVHAHINKLTTLALLCLHGAVPVLLIHIQGDDGTAMVFAFIFICMLFAAGLSWKYIAAAVGVLAVFAPIAWFKILNYDQKQRILVLFNPGSNDAVETQQLLGRIAIGSGKIFGVGLFSGEHQYVPEMYNDFIFSFIGNALGFLGCMGTIFLLIFIAVRMLMTGMKSQDALGRFICVGIFAIIAFQTIINVGMNLSLLPVIGIPLPFISGGGTAAVMTYAGVGLVLSVYRFNRKQLFL